MAILGSLLKRGIRLTAVVQRRRLNALKQQQKAFTKLIVKARVTEFGQQYGFDNLLNAVQFGKGKAFYELYKQTVPDLRLQQNFR